MSAEDWYRRASALGHMEARARLQILRDPLAVNEQVQDLCEFGETIGTPAR